MPTTRAVDLAPQWLAHLSEEFELDYMRSLSNFLRAEKAAGKTIYPQGKNIFKALNTTSLDQVKVVILGQDPYHGVGQAHGLSFSVPPDTDIPPSLRNIYQELQSDLGIAPPKKGYLLGWAQQGVLLLNSVLTVQAGVAGSHQGKGWERFTDAVIKVVNDHAKPSVFLLWGNYAQKKGSVINQQTHLVLTAPHPSPLSAHRGFFGCRHFSKANLFLQQQGRTPIDWQVQ